MVSNLFQVSSIIPFPGVAIQNWLTFITNDVSTAQVEPSTNEVLVDLLRPEFYKDTDQAHALPMLGLLMVASYCSMDVFTFMLLKACIQMCVSQIVSQVLMSLKE